MEKKRSAVLIAGPTASGKSALAVRLAVERGGIVVNADSMQVYDVLSDLTARPDAEALSQVPHALYGFVSPAQRFSTGAWLNEVQQVIARTQAEGTPLVFVGGTGLYFDALLQGVAEVPPVDASFVLAAEKELEGLDREERGALLLAHDPEMAALIKEPDRQRVARALSVLAATGRSLAYWQAQGQSGALDDFDVERMVVDPGRDVSRARIAERFERMLELGAVEEVAALMALKLDPSLPAMKAIGVREIASWQAGEISREAAIEKAVIATARYAKRQRTWLRNRMGDWPRVEVR